jgi:hypothetical protein
MSLNSNTICKQDNFTNESPGYKELIDMLVYRLTISKSYWHTNNTIFDVNFTYLGEFVVMVSYPMRQIWRQENTKSAKKFWENYDVYKAMQEDKLDSLTMELEYLYDKIKEKGDHVYFNS